ncbi:MAG: PAS domain S-box protein [Caldilineaceae bacterium]
MKLQYDQAALDYRQQFFDDAPAMYVVTIDEVAPIVLDVNQTFLNTLGYTRDQVIGSPLTKFYAAESVQLMQQGGYRRALQARFEHEERELVTATGDIVPVMLRALPLYNAQGSVVGTKAMFANMTPIKEAQNQSRREQQFTQMVFDTIDAIVLVLDQQGRIVRHNAASERLGGLSVDKIDGMYFWDVFASEALKESTKRDIQQNVIHQLRPCEMDLEWLAELGERRLATWNITPLLDVNNQINFIIVSGIDITARAKGEQAVKESELRFRQLAENIRDVFYISNLADQTMYYISPAYETIWGRTCDSLYANPSSFVESIYPPDRERVVHALQRQAEGEDTVEEYRILRPNGDMRRIFDRAFPIRDAQGNVYRVVGIAEDITERKMAEMTLGHRLRLETLISQLSTRFVQCPSDLLNDLIKTTLAEIGELVRAERGYILEASEDGLKVTNTYEWCAQGVSPYADKLQNVPLAQPGQIVWQLKQGHAVNIEKSGTLHRHSAPTRKTTQPRTRSWRVIRTTRPPRWPSPFDSRGGSGACWASTPL